MGPWFLVFFSKGINEHQGNQPEICQKWQSGAGVVFVNWAVFSNRKRGLFIKQRRLWDSNGIWPSIVGVWPSETWGKTWYDHTVRNLLESPSMFHAFSVTVTGSFSGNNFSVFQYVLVWCLLRWFTLRLGEVWTAAGLLLFMPDMKAGQTMHCGRPKLAGPVMLDGKICNHINLYSISYYVFICFFL